jgi:hypothetical protein
VWVQSQLAARDMLHGIYKDFQRGSRTCGFLQFRPPLKFEKFLISQKIGISDGGFRWRDERKRAENI